MDKYATILGLVFLKCEMRKINFLTELLSILNEIIY